MSFEKETATAATVSSQRMGVLTRDTVDIVARILEFSRDFQNVNWCKLFTYRS